MDKLTVAQRNAVTAEMRRVWRKIMSRHYHQQGEIQSWDKANGTDDPVTRADIRGEKAFVRFLTHFTPGCTIIGEETVGTDGAMHDRLKKSPGIVWTVDPVDGTANFREKNPNFGIMLGCVIDGVTQHAWILCPERDGGTLLTATRDEGAFIKYGRQAPQRLKPLNPALEQLSLGCYAVGADMLSRRETQSAIQKTLSPYTAGSYHHKCSAADTVDIATKGNKIIGYIRPKVWDCVPPSLILREMGGVAAPLDNLDADMFGYSEGGLVIFAPSRENVRELHRRLPEGAAAFKC